MNKAIAVVLASGGMDSCVTTAIAARDYLPAMLHIQYGQRTQAREVQAFHAIADHFGVEQRLVSHLDHLRLIGGSSLTDSNIPVSGANLESHEVPSSYVPFRNAHLLAIATSWAEVLGAERIFFGAVEEDSSGYPDCRQTFIEAYNRVIEEGTRPDTRLKIETPLIKLTKAEIITLGFQLAAPLHLTWSCYQESDRACGRCDSCALRLRGFYRAGRRDPIAYLEDGLRDKYH